MLFRSRPVADEGAAVLPILRRILAIVSDKNYKGTLKRAYINEVMLATHSFAIKHKSYTAKLGKSAKPTKLSRQQKYMLSLLSQGYKNAEISEISGLGIPTIKTHMALAYKKLEVNNAMDAVLKARELGFID